MPAKNDKKKPTESVAKPVRVSSAYTRVVGTVRLDVVNTRQNPAEKTTRGKKKWEVIATNLTTNRRTHVGTTDKKYPAIDVLLNREKKLKADAAEKAAKSDA
tara:strand:- start:64 stop:369 length:306 start_codon:yes stop_codon:yes gene_type:complete